MYENSSRDSGVKSVSNQPLSRKRIQPRINFEPITINTEEESDVYIEVSNFEVEPEFPEIIIEISSASEEETCVIDEFNYEQIEDDHRNGMDDCQNDLNLRIATNSEYISLVRECFR